MLRGVKFERLYKHTFFSLIIYKRKKVVDQSRKLDQIFKVLKILFEQNADIRKNTDWKNNHLRGRTK